MPLDSDSLRNSSSVDEPLNAKAKPKRSYKIFVTVVVVLLVGILAWWLREPLSLDRWVQNETWLRELQQRSPWLVLCVAFLIYVSVTGLSLPGAAVLTLVCGWYFGFLQALVLVSFASTLGATLAMLLSRFLLRDWVLERWGDRYRRIEAAFENEGSYYLFSLRLIPAVPFFLVNVLMGLTKIRVETFWWVSQLGMLPGTIAYTYAGSTLPSLRELQERGIGSILDFRIALAFAAIGLLPLVIKRFMPQRVQGEAKPENK